MTTSQRDPPMAPCKHHQRSPAPIVVAYQGERGSFSETATIRYFSEYDPEAQLEFVPCKTFALMFDALSSGRAMRLVVPIENSLAGTIHENLDLLLRHGHGGRMHIVGELDLPVRHCLLALDSSVTLQSLQTVKSHPMALAQCTAFLEDRGLKSEVGYDTAGCAKLIAEHRLHDTAAIASAHAAKIYNLHVVAENIQDNMNNYTRFLIISNSPNEADEPRRDGPWKTSIAFSLINSPGILCRALSVFAVSSIDLSKIESRHIHTVRRALGGTEADDDKNAKRWGYVFYVDIERSAHDGAVKAALNHLQQITTFYRLLGTYPAHKSTNTSSQAQA